VSVVFSSSLGGRAKASQRVYHDIQSLVLTCVLAMRRFADVTDGDSEPERGD